MLLKPKGKSHERHERETMSIIAKQVGMSPTTFRRAKYIHDYADPEVLELFKKGELSVWRAYKLTYRKQINKLFDILEKQKEGEKHEK